MGYDDKIIYSFSVVAYCKSTHALFQIKFTVYNLIFYSQFGTSCVFYRVALHLHPPVTLLPRQAVIPTHSNFYHGT